jgi:hypothetical protein
MTQALEFLQEPGATTMDGALAVAARLAISGLLGSWIALLYRFARPVTTRHSGLLPTLVLLSMLITLVTLAVGSNIAVAFTLVGTLAIVRFRTTVSDVRDTTFVIFSVAVGIAVGQSVLVAAVGCGVLSVAVAALLPTGLLASEGGATVPVGAANATLRVIVAPPSTDTALYRPVLERFGVTASLRESRAEREGARLRLTFACVVPDLGRGPELVTALLEQPDVVQARLEAVEAEA